MKGERAFILGVILGVAGSLITDLPSAVLLHQSQPNIRPILWGTYIVFGLAILCILAEVYK